MKTLKILPNVFALLREILLANELPPEKLHASLGKFVGTLDMYKSSNLINNDTEAQLINEITEGTDGFLLVLELCTLFDNKGKIKK